MIKAQITEKPWGSFTTFTKNEVSTVKILNIKAGEELSLQYHKERSEFWHILNGWGFVIKGEEELKAQIGDEFFIEKLEKHSIKAETDMRVLEIALGHFDEEEIVRVSDKYGR